MVKRTDRPAMTIAVDMGRKATKTKNKIIVEASEMPLFNSKSWYGTLYSHTD